MLTSKGRPICRRAAAAAAIVLAALLAQAGPAAAQQRPFVPPPPINTNQGGGSVLELAPTTPSRQGGDALTVPQFKSQPGQELELPSRALRNQSGYEQVTVTVTDQNGRYVTGLQKSDFRLYVDGIQRPIEFLRQDLNTPVSIGILADTSGSMEPKLMQLRAAIGQFIRDLNQRDDVFLFAFSNRPFLLQPFTTNHFLVTSRLALLHAYGQTALFDTIMDGLIMVKHGRYDKKALLVVTDGMDNASQATLAQVIGQARRMGVLIYSIGIGDPNSGGVGIAIGPFMFGGDIDHVDTRTLSALSSETGARTFLVREVGDGEALRQDCAAISNELREQYTAGFVAPDPSRGGYRSLRVDVPARPELHVRVRKGVTVGPGTEYAGPATAP
ncbi:MAG TPA: VWA domain-containing protein [Candidatus Binataceae bacterium]|jgi:Ca-activated chloride channel family protein|nr:VWA domain-containing protein [Candidatus Binataceae bacterium]